MKIISRYFLAFVSVSLAAAVTEAVSPPPDGRYSGGNTAEGQNALQNTTTGSFNSAVGFISLFANTTGSYNTAVGAGTLEVNTANSNTAIGAAALLLNIGGTQNTAIGVNALVVNNIGSDNTAAGVLALSNNTAGNRNTAIGIQALSLMATGSGNIALGYQAGSSLTSGNNNIDIGNVGASAESNTIRIGDPAIHAAVFLAGVTAFNPAAPNQAVLIDPTTGQLGSADLASFGVVSTTPENTAVGDQALSSNTGESNTATGFRAIFANTNGSHNTATGAHALENNDSGNFNNAMGTLALINNTAGTSNNAFGDSALFSNVTGIQNTAIGDLALSNNEDGAANVVIGASALTENIHGSYNTVVGDSAGNSVEGNDNIYLGATSADGVPTESGTIRIGDPNFVFTCYVAGIAGATATNGSAVLVDANGKLGTVTSSARFKDDIKPMGRASEALFALKPVTFRYKKGIDPASRSQFGLVAEDVEAVDPDLVVRDKEGKAYSVRYEQVNAMLLNEFLKEHRKNEQQEAMIAQLKATTAMLTATLKEQASQIQHLGSRLGLANPTARTVLNDR
jgi:trimeric autotransporter adhesin